MNTNHAEARVISVGELKKLQLTFFIPWYQRGYRWTEQQIVVLIDDLKEFSEKRSDPQESDVQKYFFQPIVVQQQDEKKYELVDGQQRLTTLFLIDKAFASLPGGENANTETYQFKFVKNNCLSSFINDIETYNNKPKGIDEYHLKKAYDCIKKKLETLDKKTNENIKESIDRHLYIIEYKIPKEVCAREVFTRINRGKIPLTNAELLKAWLLSPTNLPEVKKSPDALAIEQSRISFRWDAIEQDLQNNNFWYFLNPEDAINYTPRIDFLFELISNKENAPQNRYAVFDALSKKNNPLGTWKDLTEAFDHLYDWYSDKEMYHQVGFLLSTTRHKAYELLEKSKKSTKKEFKSTVKRMIKEKILGKKNLDTVLAALRYDTNKDQTKIQDLLILFNVLSTANTQNPQDRFPFAEHNDKNKKWDIEHIHPQNPAPLDGSKIITRYCWAKENLEYLVNFIKPETQLLDNTDNDKINECFKKLPHPDKSAYTEKNVKELDTIVKDIEGIINKINDKHPTEDLHGLANDEHRTKELHGLANLALLNSSSNRAIKNYALWLKRKMLLDMYKEGSYIPICTYRAFTGFYNDDGRTDMFWKADDREAYFQQMKETFSKFLEKDQEEQNNG